MSGGDPMIEARGLMVALGGRRVLDGVDFRLAAGEVVGLVGPNGAGKTTLLRALAGLQVPDGGGVELAGRPLAATPRAERARRLAYLAQGADLAWPLTVERLVTLGRLPHLEPWSRPGPSDAAAVAQAMAEADVAAFATRPVTELSAGERMRALLARALAVGAPVLLADEPVAALDPYHQLQVMDLLRRRAAAGGGVAVVLHDLALAARYCDRLVLLVGGRVLAEGTPDLVLTADRLRRAWGVEARFLQIDNTLVVLPWQRLPPEASP